SRSARDPSAGFRAAEDQTDSQCPISFSLSSALQHDKLKAYRTPMKILDAILKPLRPLLLGLWLGAAIFFGAAVAPNLFGVLRAANLANANELAGTIVTHLLAIINRGGFEIGLFLLITTYFVSKYESRLVSFDEIISLAILAIMTGVSSLVNLGENAGKSRFIVCASRSECWQRSATARVR